MTQPNVTLYTDGACKGNPGVGGWGVLMQSGLNTKELFGGEAITTNNQMELTAVIKGLQALKRPCNVTIYTDSKYVMQGMQTWIHDWKKRDWKTANKKPVKNKELWQALDKATTEHHIQWHWVKGHAGHPGNGKADELANIGAASVMNNE